MDMSKTGEILIARHIYLKAQSMKDLTMKSNRTHPQRRFDEHLFESTERLEEDCCGECGGCQCCSRRAVCISSVVLLGLALAVVGVVVALVFGIPERPPVNRACKTAENKTGFLCDDRLTCIPPSDLCNGIMNCQGGADEERDMCSNLPESLPAGLVFRCGIPQFWIFIDKKCNLINDCGDCSDETGVYAGCPPTCGAAWWSCTPVEFQYCNCIPRSLCRDGHQNCFDWSDEYTCPKPS